MKMISKNIIQCNIENDVHTYKIKQNVIFHKFNWKNNNNLQNKN